MTYPALFGLIAATGLRLSEATGLDDADADLDAGTLVIRDSKFGSYAEGAVMPSPVTGLVACSSCAQDCSA